ncbi:MAG TPA: AraC family transcriptional regulator [Sphingobacterium sp.]|nr:AraC family transcriptional regulator [Sphingobacterium sp.]
MIENVFPSGILSAFIVKYSFIDIPFHIPVEKCIPDGSVKLFIYEGDYYADYFSSNGNRLDWKDGLSAHCLSNDCYIEVPKKGLRLTICYFKASMFYQLFKIPIYLMNDGIMDLDEILGPDYRSLKDQLVNSADNNERAEILNRYFEKQVRKSKFLLNSAVNLSENCIMRQQGNININALMSDLNISRRTLERKFIDEIGMSPKMFCKIIRFNYAFLLKKIRPTATWQEIVYQCGYYDQSHYIAEFKYFAGFPPSVYYDKDVTISSLYVGSFIEKK